MELNFIIILFFSILFLLLISFYYIKKNIVSPSLITFFMFLFSCSCIVYNYKFWNVHYSIKAYLVVMLGLISMLLIELFVVKIKKSCNYVNNFEKVKEIKVNYFFNIFLLTLGIILIIYQSLEIYHIGKNLGSSGLNFIGLVKYSKNIKLSILSKIAYRYIWVLFTVYTYIFFNNVFRCNKKYYKNKKYIFPFILVILSSFFMGNRASLIRIFIIIYIFWGIIEIEKKGINGIKLKYMFKRIFFISSLLLLIFYLMRSITKIKTSTINRSFIDYITYYIGSPLYLFDKYLENPLFVQEKPLYFAENTLASLYKTFGIKVNIIYNYTLVGGQSNFAGNVYSWFQIPYHDFGFLGMLLFTVLIYGLFSYVYYIKICNTKNSLSRDYFILFYGYFFYVIVMSFYYCQTNITVSVTNFIYFLLIIILYRFCRILK